MRYQVEFYRLPIGTAFCYHGESFHKTSERGQQLAPKSSSDATFQRTTLVLVGRATANLIYNGGL